jgi:hypothetical protein
MFTADKLTRKLVRSAALRRPWIAAGIALGLAVTGAAPPAIRVAMAADKPPAEWDGLVRKESKQLDNLYVLPGANLNGYKRVQIDALQVAFDKNWDPNRNQRDLSRRLTKDDFEEIKKTLAEEFLKEFTKELMRGGYEVVNEAGDDVLRVSPGIVNLYITAPDKMAPGRSRTYTASSGHMTLVAELRDSDTNKLLARAVDTVQGRQAADFQISNRATNIGDARVALQKWAIILREGLDDANGRGDKS